MEKIELFSCATIKDAFNDFILSIKTKGLAEKILESYQYQSGAVSKHLDITMNIFALCSLFIVTTTLSIPTINCLRSVAA